MMATVSAMQCVPGRMDRMSLIYSFDDVRIDLQSHRLIRAGGEIALEPKAFAVLTLLLEHPGELLARERLLDTVWGHGHVAPATLNRIIAVLRRALDDDSAAPKYIETVHGLGYRFVAQLRREPRPKADSALPLEAVAGNDEQAGAAIGENSAPATMPSPASPRRILVAALALLVLGLLAARPWLSSLSGAAPPPIADVPTLVVLPFDAAGGDEEQRAAAMVCRKA